MYIVADHGVGNLLCVHFSEGLVLLSRHKEIGDLPKGQPQGDDLTLSDITGSLKDMDDSERDPCAPLVILNFLLSLPWVAEAELLMMKGQSLMLLEKSTLYRLRCLGPHHIWHTEQTRGGQS